MCTTHFPVRTSVKHYEQQIFIENIALYKLEATQYNNNYHKILCIQQFFLEAIRCCKSIHRKRAIYSIFLDAEVVLGYQSDQGKLQTPTNPDHVSKGEAATKNA